MSRNVLISIRGAGKKHCNRCKYCSYTFGCPGHCLLFGKNLQGPYGPLYTYIRLPECLRTEKRLHTNYIKNVWGDI